MQACDARQTFVGRHDRADVQQTQTLHLPRRTFDAFGVGYGLAQHLIAAANAQHLPATPQMRDKVHIPAAP